MSDPLRSHVCVEIDGAPVEVAQGSTVAAALAVCGASAKGTRRSVGGEPRAALCGLGVCQECRVTIDGRAHVLACQTLCRDGQIIRTIQTTGQR